MENKILKHVASNYGYQLVCVDDKFSKPIKSYLGQLVMTKEDDEDFGNSNKCSICDNCSVEGDVKVRDNSHITGKYRGSAHRDCNINMLELGKCNFKIKVIPNGVEKNMSFNINNNFSLLIAFHF